jgi:hypothetical protein
VLENIKLGELVGGGLTKNSVFRALTSRPEKYIPIISTVTKNNNRKLGVRTLFHYLLGALPRQRTLKPNKISIVIINSIGLSCISPFYLNNAPDLGLSKDCIFGIPHAIILSIPAEITKY